ncbi:MAG: hypothetical protein DME60_04375, partial [Verrucomicrobia bacterium]
QFTVGPVGLSVPELGVAERNAVAKNANTTRKTPITKKSALIVVRAVIEEEIFFIGKGLDKLFVLRIGKMAKCGRLTSAARATKFTTQLFTTAASIVRNLEIALNGVSAKIQPLRLIQPCRSVDASVCQMG